MKKRIRIIRKPPKLLNDKEIKYVVYTDGSCFHNTGRGGWAAVAVYYSGGVKHEITLSEGYRLTTNNRMELRAVIEILKALGPNKTFEIHTDSAYVMNGARFWLRNWKKTGWVTRTGTPVINRDLWMTLEDLMSKNKVRWFKVKAHSGVEGNEKADARAKKAAANGKEVDVVYEETVSGKGPTYNWSEPIVL